MRSKTSSNLSGEEPVTLNSTKSLCPACKQGAMKRSNFRTGSVDKPKADVQVCTHCGHRTEQAS